MPLHSDFVIARMLIKIGSAFFFFFFFKQFFMICVISLLEKCRGRRKFHVCTNFTTHFTFLFSTFKEFDLENSHLSCI